MLKMKFEIRNFLVAFSVTFIQYLLKILRILLQYLRPFVPVGRIFVNTACRSANVSSVIPDRNRPA